MKRILLFVPILVGLVGCGNPDAKVVGQWKFQDIKLAKADPNEKIVRQMLSNVTYELKEDHTFTMTGVVSTEGKWKLDGSKVEMTVEKAQGQPVAELKKQLQAQMGNNPQAKASLDKLDQPSVGTVSADGKTLTIAGNGGSQAEVILGKVG